MRILVRSLLMISIHALREEGDKFRIRSCFPPYLFLSTPSARRATDAKNIRQQPCRISIHALREEGDGNKPEE